jgi:hypothetical protein
MLKPLDEVSGGCKAASLKIFRPDVLTQSLCLIAVGSALRPRNFEMVVRRKRQSVLKNDEAAYL